MYNKYGICQSGGYSTVLYMLCSLESAQMAPELQGAHFLWKSKMAFESSNKIRNILVVENDEIYQCAKNQSEIRWFLGWAK
jgi:hypothetical protein